MRTSTFIVSTVTAFLLVSCGLFDSEQRSAEHNDQASAVPTASSEPVKAKPSVEVTSVPSATVEADQTEPSVEVSAVPSATPEPVKAEPSVEVTSVPTASSEPVKAEPNVEVSAVPTASSEADPADPSVEATSVPTAWSEPDQAEQSVEVSTVSPAAPEVPLGRASSFPPAYDGPTSLEARILASPVIARVRLESVSTSVETGNTYRGLKPIPLLEFNFSVLAYLKGNGADDIVAVWAHSFFDTQQEAEDALPAIAADRDARWDDREAIVLLQHTVTYLPSTQQAGRFFLSGEHLVGVASDDYYSLASRGNKLWLPAEAATGAPSQPSGDQQRFLTDVPPATGTAPTITLGELKTRIAAVAAKLDAGDGSEEYRECLERTYSFEGKNQYRISTRGEGFLPRIPDQELASGLAASSVVHEKLAYGGLPNIRAEVWLEGADADLFSVMYGDSVHHDFSGDGVIDSIRYVRRVLSARPLPAGTYSAFYNHRDVPFVPCDGYTYRHEWTVAAVAPEGTLHEAFFDPVTDGAAVAADGANGVLKPATFTGTDGASATIERIEWESGTVKLEVSPHTGLSGHILDFIELDGTTSLSLNADQATVDAANDTLSWSVASQPWHDGDELMVRVERGPCWNNTAVPNQADNPGLMRDCINLLAAKDALRGTAALNWSVDTTISDWDGVTVQGSPSRVKRLVLVEDSLTGTLPPELGRLDGLEYLWLNNNRLTGEIPAALGDLGNLLNLRLGNNQLTGCIPPALRDVDENDLTNLGLQDCATP